MHLATTRMSTLDEPQLLSPHTPSGQDADRKYKPDKRSRTGCLTCKRRKKRCIEIYVDKACQRCRDGGYLCEPGAPPGLRIVKSPKARKPRLKSGQISESDLGPSPPVTDKPLNYNTPFQMDMNSASSLDVSYQRSTAVTLSEDQPLAGPSNYFQQNGGEGLQDAVTSAPTTLAAAALVAPIPSEELYTAGAIWAGVYDHLNKNFLASMPEKPRALLRTRMLIIAGMDDMTIAAQCALSIEFYAMLKIQVDELQEGDHCCWFSASDDLTEGGPKAVLQRLSSNLPDSDALAEPQVLRDRATRFYNEALRLFGLKIMPLEAALWAVIDLHTVTMARHLSPYCYGVLDIGETLISSYLGPRPAFGLREMSSQTAFPLRSFAQCDILRCVAMLNRRPFLFLRMDLEGGDANPGAEYATQQDWVDAEACAIYQGQPWLLLVTLAEVAELLAARAAGVVDEEEALKRGQRLELFLDTLDLTLVAAPHDVTTAELWREATIIYLYQEVYRAGRSHKRLRRALRYSISLTEQLLPTKPSFLSCPVFLVATLALEDSDRALLRQYLRQSMPGQGGPNNCRLAEEIWREADEEARATSWRDVALNIGLLPTLW